MAFLNDKFTCFEPKIFAEATNPIISRQEGYSTNIGYDWYW